MTSNALRAKEIRQKEQQSKREDKTRRDIAEQVDKTTRRGQNFRVVSDAASLLGKSVKPGMVAGAVKALTSASLNDIAWYIKENDIGADIASGAYGVRTGAAFPVEGMFMQRRSGICLIATTPSIGISRAKTSAVNTAARNLDAFVRSKNSRSSGFDPVDIMQMMICLGNMYAVYGHITRLIKLEQSASASNAYVPQGILQAMGINVDDSIKSLASDRARLNVIGDQINQAFAAPPDLTYFARMLFMYSRVFCDTEDSNFGQLYAYVPDGFFAYNESIGSCTYQPLAYDGWLDNISGYNTFRPTTVAAWIDVLNAMYTTLATSEYANIMSADIRNAYKDTGLYVLPHIGEEDTITLDYDPIVLNQMHNCQIPAKRPNYNLNITQNNATLLYRPGFSVNADEYVAVPKALTKDRLITVDVPNPTWETTVEVSRGQVVLTIEDEGDAGHVVYYESTGSDFPTSMSLVYFNDTGAISRLNIAGVLSYAAATPNEVNVSGSILDLLSDFYYHPMVYITSVASTPGTPAEKDYYSFFGRDYVSVMPKASLTSMNDVILYNMFNVILSINRQ